LGAAGRYLDDAVGLGFGEAGQGRIQRLRRRHVDRRIGKGLAFGLVEHLNVGLRGSDRHGTLLNERVRTPIISGRWVTGESGRRRRRTERRIARNKRRIARNKWRTGGNE